MSFDIPRDDPADKDEYEQWEKAMTKQWRPFEADCLHCGGGAEVFTESDQGNTAYDGDPARCSECGCPGVVVVDIHIDPNEGAAAIAWHDEPGCTCEWCISHPIPKES